MARIAVFLPSMITIREATAEDIPLIRNLAARIWPDAFGEILSSEQIAYMLDWMYSPRALESQLASGHHFLVAGDQGAVSGYASWEAPPAADFVKLHKLYVLPSAQGTGAGKALMEKVVDEARARGRISLRLNVNRANKAVAFYQKRGFRIVGEEDNPIGNGYFMNDYVMALSC